MIARIPLVALWIILSVVLVIPAVIVANPDQVNQASQASVKEIKDYSPLDVSFHSQGHIQRWDNSPLSAQNPHLWTAMLLTVIVSGGIFTSLLRKKPLEAKENRENQINKYIDELKTREERLNKKFQEVDRKYCLGKITESDYSLFLKSYEENLAKTQGDIHELNELKIWMSKNNLDKREDTSY